MEVGNLLHLDRRIVPARALSEARLEHDLILVEAEELQRVIRERLVLSEHIFAPGSEGHPVGVRVAVRALQLTQHLGHLPMCTRGLSEIHPYSLPRTHIW